MFRSFQSSLLKNRSIDAVFHKLMQECRRSAPGVHLSAHLRSTLERLPLSERRKLVRHTQERCAPLFVCARRGSAAIVEYLVDVCEASIEQCGVCEGLDVTPLWCASVTGWPEVVRVLADAGANLNEENDYCSTPVRSACYLNHEAVVRELVERGADIHRASQNGITCLISSIESPSICAYLISKGVSVNACDLQQRTALHYAAQNGIYASVELLIDKGGADPHRVTRAGDDVMQTAALKGADDIMSLLASRTSYSVSQLANAHELLGATQLDDSNDIEAAMANWRRATVLRHSSTDYLEKEPKRPPHSALGFAREWRTFEELDSAAANRDAMRVQTLLVADRLLGPNHIDKVLRLMFRGASYIDAFRYQRCIELWSWALEIRVERDTLLYTDTWNIACALTQLMLEAHEGRLESGNGVPRHRDVVSVFDMVASQLPDARRCLEIRPVYRKQAINFHSVLCCVTHLIYLMLNTASNEEELASVHQKVRLLVEQDIRSAHNGDTLLHMCVSRLTDLKSSYFTVDEAVPPIFPSIPVVQLLARCGANPVQRNEARSTALHVAAIPNNYSPELISCLVSAGGHLDQVNRFGDTALGLVTARDDHQLYPLKHVTLGCLAARALLSDERYSNVRQGDLPQTLHEFLDLHRSSSKH